MCDSTPLLKIAGITKRFGNLVANDAISLELYKGEILALLGENGAGKTTLMNILFGHYVADEGSIEVCGSPLRQGAPKDALEVGLGMVHQHFTLADNMTVLDNIVLGTEPIYRLFRKDSSAIKKIQALIDQYELDVDYRSVVKNLSVGQRQRVEILKALYRDTRILILDEPTAVLTPQESDHLFSTLSLLVDKGLAIIFITHKLREVMAVSDRCMVLRHGKLTYSSATKDTDIDTLAREMVGGTVPEVRRLEVEPGETLLRIDHVSAVDGAKRLLLDDISMDVKAGEIIGIAGVSGNGQGNLADLVSGLITPSEGTMYLHGEPVELPSPRKMLKLGVGRIPEDRVGTGLIGDMTVSENCLLESYTQREFNTFGVMKAKSIQARTSDIIKRFDVRCAGGQSPARTMSGGNMQKLILGRVLSENPTVIIANQPTWGLDVGATAFVHKQLLAASRNGAAVIVISDDLDELFTVADYIQIMYKGTLSLPVRPADTDARDIGLAMSGQRDIIFSAMPGGMTNEA